MSALHADPAEFGELRPKLLLLLRLHADAASDEARAGLVREFEAAFLATAWHVARDLLDNGYEPVVASPARDGAHGRLRVVSSVDAA
jgi:hypothetical protein